MSNPRTGRTATLLITCRDRTGLVACVSEFLARHGGNVTHADQHVDRSEDLFLQRVEWELDGFDLDLSEFTAAFAPIAEPCGMHWELRTRDRLPRVVVLVSRLGHCMYDLLARWRMGELDADVRAVLSNHDTLAQGAERFGVPFAMVPITNATRDEQEREILDRLESERVDLVILARYMQVLSARFVERYAQRIINIHHSFLPAFAGARPYHQAHARGVKIIGATAHYVTEELDAGPIIAQDVARVSHRDSVRDLMARGRDLEKTVLARAVDLHLRDRVLVYGNKTVVFD